MHMEEVFIIKNIKKITEFVKQQLQGGEPTKYNITFDISKYCKNYNLYIENKLSLVELYNKFINITFEEQIKHLNRE